MTTIDRHACVRAPANARRVMTVLVISALATLTFSCSAIEGAFQKTGDSAAAQSGPSGGAVAAFQTGMYAFATANCAQCHASSINPMFAQADVSAAYSALLPYIDCADPSSSVVAQNSGNGHCGVPTCQNSANPATVTTDVTNWCTAIAAGGGTSNLGPNGCPNSPPGLVPSTATYFLPPMPIPSPLPSATASPGVPINWDLSTVTPASSTLNGAYFQVQLSLLSPTTYQVSIPTLATPTNAVTVAGIHVMVMEAGQSSPGCEYPEAALWLDVPSTTVAAKTFTVPTGTTILKGTILSPDQVQIPVLSSADQIVIGFDTLSAP